MTESPAEAPKQSNKMAQLQRISKWLAIILGAFALLLGIAFGYLYTHQTEIKNAITQNLNEQLNTKISVGEVKIDFFSKFPEVSLKFANVRAAEALPVSEQSLFLFRGIFVRFSIWDLLGKDYTIRKLSFDDGEVNLRITKMGEVNYIFWKENTDDDAPETTIALENVEINNAKFRYIDEHRKLRVLVEVDHLDVNGAFKDAIFSAEIEGEGNLNDLTYEDLDFADSMKITTSGTFTTALGETKINVAKLILQDVEMAGNGTIRTDYQAWKIQSSSTRLRHWLPIIPQAWRPTFNPTILGGDAITTIGVILDGNTQEVSATSVLKDASLHIEHHNFLVQNTNGSIAFRYVASGKKNESSLKLNNIKAKTKTGDIELSLAVNNLFSPDIFANGRFNLQIEELMGIARPGLLKEARGIAKGNFTYQQKFKDWESMKEKALSSPKLTGELHVTQGEMSFENSNIVLQEISADIIMRDKDLNIERVFLREGESEFSLQGWLYNALYFGANRPVPKLDISLQSNYVDLDRITAWELPRKATDDTVYTTDRNQPPAIDYIVKLNVKKFDLIKFTGENLTGEVWNENLKIKGRDISFLALDGKISGGFSWATEPTGYRFWTKGNMTRIDIHQLFNGFENFGQNWLLADNIYGTGTASIETSMDFDRKMKFLPGSLKLVTDITIENGRLKGYKPLMSLSSLVEKQALEDVKFERLHNKIAIDDQVITIPQMEIKSTALNLLLQGRHSFDQQIDYSIRLALKDVMGNKRKDKKTDLDDWIQEVETTDQPYIWVHVGCSIAEPCLSLDRELVKKGVKKEWQQQGEDIKNIFKPTDKNAPPKKDPTKGEVIFEWNEEEPDTSSAGY